MRATTIDNFEEMSWVLQDDRAIPFVIANGLQKDGVIYRFVAKKRLFSK